MSDFDDVALRSAMRDYLAACDRLNGVGADEDKQVLDLADAKSLAAITLRRRLQELGWTPPARNAGEGLGVGRSVEH